MSSTGELQQRPGSDGKHTVSVPSVDEKPSFVEDSDPSSTSYATKERDSGSIDPALEVVNAAAGVDVAAHLVAGAHADDAIDPEASARVKRKIDWRLLPLLFLLYTGMLCLQKCSSSYSLLTILALCLRLVQGIDK